MYLHLGKGTVVNTPFGKAGKIYDSGCAADTLDVYTDFQDKVINSYFVKNYI